MKIMKLLVIICLMSSATLAEDYQVERYVMASGGGEMLSTNYGVNGTMGQTVVGASSSASYTIESGYWVGAVAVGGCDYVVGDVNGSDSYNGLDITYGVNFFKGGSDPICDTCDCPPHPFFWVCGDVNASCSYNGLDITYGVNFFKGGADPIPCPDCPPSGGLIVTSSTSHVEKPTVINRSRTAENELRK